MMKSFVIIAVIATAVAFNEDTVVPEESEMQPLEFEPVSLEQLYNQCPQMRTEHQKSAKKVTDTLKLVKKALAREKKLCDAEAKASEKKKKEAAKLHIGGPTFEFSPSPCKGGKGKFSKKLLKDARATVGVIPAGQNNVKVFMKAEDDVDLEVWGPFGKVAIVAFSCQHINRVHKTPTACLDAGDKSKIKYAGATIHYSGWDGQMGKYGYKNSGYEYIKIEGKSKVPLTIKTYGYVPGTGKVTYSWGPDKKECAKRAKLAKKAAKAAYDAKKAALKNMRESQFKKVAHALASATKTCSGAKGSVKAMQSAVQLARNNVNKWAAKIRSCVEKKAKEQATKKEQKRKSILAEKNNKEVAAKAMERKRKKVESEKREKTVKENLRKKAEKRDKKENADKKRLEQQRKAEKARKLEASNKEQTAKQQERQGKEKQTKVEQQAKALERQQKAKEGEGKQKERTRKAELAAKAKEQQQKVEKANKKKIELAGKAREKAKKHQKEQAEKAAERARKAQEKAKKRESTAKESSSKESASKERTAKRVEQQQKQEKKSKQQQEANTKAAQAARDAQRKAQELKSKRCRTREWATNFWYAWTDCCRGCDGRAPAPGGMRGACVWKRKYNWGKDKSQCGCRATPRGTIDFNTNRYYFGVDCCKGCQAAQSQCIARHKGAAWTSVCTCRMSC